MCYPSFKDMHFKGSISGWKRVAWIAGAVASSVGYPLAAHNSPRVQAQVGGATVQTTRFHADGTNSSSDDVVPSAHTQWVANYRTCTEGRYWASVRVMFVASSSTTATGNAYHGALAYPCTRTMDLWSPFSVQFMQKQTEGGSGEDCNGLWRWTNYTAATTASPYLSIFWPNNPVANVPCSEHQLCDPALSEQQFRFESERLSADAVRSCVSTKRVCFVGDSQSENLDFSLIRVVQDLLGENRTCHRFFHQDANSGKAWKHTVRAVAFAPSCGYNTYIPFQGYTINGRYSLNLEDSDVFRIARDANCTDVIINFGHWPLFFKSGWTVDDFAMRFTRVFDDIVSYRAKAPHVKWYWGSMNPVGGSWAESAGALTSDLKKQWSNRYFPRTCPVSDGRLPFWIEAMNELAHKLYISNPAYASSFGYIDHYAISSQFGELSFDGSHYQGVVGGELARNVIRTTCGMGRATGSPG